jgi:membrane associated rhomboid family serine protease
MFLHGGLAHLAFNMLILAALGDRLEALYGPGRFAALYLLAGLAAALVQWGWAPLSPTPVIGASGAISGLIGAQALLAGRSGRGPLGRAAALLLAWTLIQLLTALVMPELNLAVPAHVGGFLGGLLLAWPLAPRVPTHR